MGFLTRVGLSSWIMIAGYAVAIGAGSYGGYKVGYHIEYVKLLEAQHQTDLAKDAQHKAENAFAALKLQYSEFQSQVEQDRATANLLTLQQQATLRGQIDVLRSQVRVATAARQKASDDLLKALALAPEADTSPLGPAAKAYYASVRQIQHGEATP